MVRDQIEKLVDDFPKIYEEHGTAVAISGSQAAIGDPSDNVLGANHRDAFDSRAGAAYVFDASTGQQAERLLASDGSGYDEFGFSVELDGTTALVGAPGWENGTGTMFSGAAYLFDAEIPRASTQTRNGSGLNATILTSVTEPLLGATWISDLDTSGHAAAFAAVTSHEQPFMGFFLAGGELLVDVTSTGLAGAVLPRFGASVRFSINVPGDLVFCALSASFQGVVLGTPGYELSNAIDVTLGF